MFLIIIMRKISLRQLQKDLKKVTKRSTKRRRTRFGFEVIKPLLKTEWLTTLSPVEQAKYKHSITGGKLGSTLKKGFGFIPIAGSVINSGGPSDDIKDQLEYTAYNKYLDDVRQKNKNAAKKEKEDIEKAERKVKEDAKKAAEKEKKDAERVARKEKEDADKIARKEKEAAALEKKQADAAKRREDEIAKIAAKAELENKKVEEKKEKAAQVLKAAQDEEEKAHTLAAKLKAEKDAHIEISGKEAEQVAVVKKVDLIKPVLEFGKKIRF